MTSYGTAVYTELAADMNTVLDTVPFLTVNRLIADGRARGLDAGDTARKLRAIAGL